MGSSCDAGGSEMAELGQGTCSDGAGVFGGESELRKSILDYGIMSVCA